MLVAGSVLAARVGVCLIAVVAIITGIALLVTRSISIEEPDGLGGITYVGVQDVTGVGTGLLCVGLLILAAFLLVEGYVLSAHRAEPSATDEG